MVVNLTSITKPWLRGLGGLIMLAGVSPCSAQIGVLDQLSPVLPSAEWSARLFVNIVAPWQQQVTPSVSGTLEGVKLRLHGAVGASFRLRIRTGAAWTGRPVVAETTVTKTATGDQVLFVPLIDANIEVRVGEPFVIEMAYINTPSIGVYGSYIAPNSGPALYPGPLYFGIVRFQDGGWRQGFETYVIPAAPRCPADINADGGVDGTDVSEFFNYWIDGNATADLNHDGGINGDDVSEFFDQWANSAC